MAENEWILKPHPTIRAATRDAPLLVVVLDGWGEAPDAPDNAIAMAATPLLDSLRDTRPEHWRTVKAHGTAVGLPTDDDMGNSEVGHNALGAGQIIDQGARLVDEAISSGRMYGYDCGWKYIQPAFAKHSVHFIGLLSDGGVHSRYDQLLPMLKEAAREGAKSIRVHVLTDGRDVADGTSIEYVQRLKADLGAIESEHPGCSARIASGGGRMRVTMDRYESDWNIVKRGWEAHVLGQAPNRFQDPTEAIQTLRGSGDGAVSDQWIEPFVIVDERGEPVGPVQDGDAVVVFNFRADRVVEISKALEYETFLSFDRQRFPKVRFAGMMQYDGELKLPQHFLVPPPSIARTTGEYLVHNGVATFACSESQKIGHVTFFWNGNRAAAFDEKLETYKEIESDRNISFDKKPKMKAVEITQAGVAALKSGKYNQVRLNFPNADMVGHTGNLEASICAAAAVDRALKELVEAVDAVGGRFLITADHGNAEIMTQHDKAGKVLKDKEGKPLLLTSHTLSPVLVAIGGKGLPKGVEFAQDVEDPGLTNVSATILNLLGFEAPSHMRPTLLA